MVKIAAMRWRDFANLPPLFPHFFDYPRRVHFIGIGGIGMSALARALVARGHIISGSDVNDGAQLQELRDLGIVVAIGQREANLDLLGAPAEAVIFSSAVAESNSERAAAQTRSIPQHHRAQLLAYFVNTAKHSIAVSGTHGKSTTSAMIAHILWKLDLNPTAILGAVYPPFGSNVHLGDPDLVVVEADESDGSFTLLHPTISVILNVEAEHLENYDESEERLWEAFAQFAAQAKSEVVLNEDDTELRRLGTDNTLFYSTNVGVNPCVWASHVTPKIGNTTYGLCCAGHHQEATGTRSYAGDFALSVAGTHNVSNALAAITAVWPNEIQPQDAAKALESFGGIGRRFELKGEAGGVLVYDDYGHHPTEVEKTLEAARDFLGRRLVVIFQPHRYSRTAQLGAQFGPAFAAADIVIITQLYSAFEEPIEGVSGQIVYNAVKESLPGKPVFYAETLTEAKRLALEAVRPGDALFTMGAGDITKLGPQLLQELKMPQD